MPLVNEYAAENCSRFIHAFFLFPRYLIFFLGIILIISLRA